MQWGVAAASPVGFYPGPPVYKLPARGAPQANQGGRGRGRGTIRGGSSASGAAMASRPTQNWPPPSSIPPPGVKYVPSPHVQKPRTFALPQRKPPQAQHGSHLPGHSGQSSSVPDLRQHQAGQGIPDSQPRVGNPGTLGSIPPDLQLDLGQLKSLQKIQSAKPPGTYDSSLSSSAPPFNTNKSTVGIASSHLTFFDLALVQDPPNAQVPDPEENKLDSTEDMVTPTQWQQVNSNKVRLDSFNFTVVPHGYESFEADNTSNMSFTKLVVLDETWRHTVTKLSNYGSGKLSLANTSVTMTPSVRGYGKYWTPRGHRILTAPFRLDSTISSHNDKIKLDPRVLFIDPCMDQYLASIAESGSKGSEINVGYIGDSTAFMLKPFVSTWIKAHAKAAGAPKLGWPSVFHGASGQDLDKLCKHELNSNAFSEMDIVIIKCQINFAECWAWGDDSNTGTRDETILGTVEDIKFLIAQVRLANPAIAVIIVGMNQISTRTNINSTTMNEDPYGIDFAKIIDSELKLAASLLPDCYFISSIEACAVGDGQKSILYEGLHMTEIPNFLVSEAIYIQILKILQARAAFELGGVETFDIQAPTTWSEDQSRYYENFILPFVKTPSPKN